MITSNSAYDWYIKQDLSDYAGKWVAIMDKKVIASNKDVKKVLDKFNEKYPNKRPFLTKIKSKLSIL